MRVLALDISTHAGWSILEVVNNKTVLKQFGLIELTKPLKEYGEYPKNIIGASQQIANDLTFLVAIHEPDWIVIEQINLGKNRHVQQYLDFIHAFALKGLLKTGKKLWYIDSSAWRSAIGLKLSKEQKQKNKELKVAKVKAAKNGSKLDKQALGIKGKITWKHLSVEWVNKTFDKDFKLCDNDICDAICLGFASILDAPHSKGL